MQRGIVIFHRSRRKERRQGDTQFGSAKQPCLAAFDALFIIAVRAFFTFVLKIKHFEVVSWQARPAIK